MTRTRSTRWLLKDVGMLATGHAAGGLLSIFSLIVTARATGVAAFGVLVMIQTFVRFVDALVNFQTWQALVKYGTEARVAEDVGAYRLVVRSCARLDLLTAIIATLVAVGLSCAAIPVFQLDSATLVFTLLYCSVILTNLTGAPMGVLRIAARFKLMAILATASMAVKLIAVLAGWLAGMPFGYFVGIWIVTDILQQVLLVGAGQREFRRNGDGSLWGPRFGLIRLRYPGFVRFVIMTNLSTSVKLAGQHLSVLLTGGILSEVAASLLKVGQTVNKIIGLIADPIDQVIYPDLSAQWAEGNLTAFKRSILAVGTIGFVIGTAITIGFAFWGKSAIVLLFGEDYNGAFDVTTLLLIGTTLLLAGIGLRGALLAMGRADTHLWIHLISYGICVPVLPWLLWTYGLIGAGIYIVVFHILRLGLGILFFLRIWFSQASLSKPPVLHQAGRTAV